MTGEQQCISGSYSPKNEAVDVYKMPWTEGLQPYLRPWIYAQTLIHIAQNDLRLLLFMNPEHPHLSFYFHSSHMLNSWFFTFSGCPTGIPSQDEICNFTI